jgi:hypothetical protein
MAPENKGIHILNPSFTKELPVMITKKKYNILTVPF